MAVESLTPYFFLAAYLLIFPASLAVYRLCFHPLSKIPGPRLAAITPLWYAYHIRRSRLLLLGQELHNKYGPAVRIAPNEVQFNSKEAFQAIYGGMGYLQKSDFYYALSNNPGYIDWLLRRHPNDDGFAINGELDIQRHRGHRKNIGTTYSAASVRKYGGAIDAVLRRFVAKLKTQEERTVELAEWVHIALVECISVVTLGLSPGFIDDGSDHGIWDVSVTKWRQISVFGFLPSLTLLVQKWPALKPAVAALCGVPIRKPDGYVPFEQVRSLSPTPTFPKTSQILRRLQVLTPVQTMMQMIKERASRFFQSEKKPAPPNTDAEAETDILTELLHLTTKKPGWKPHHAVGMAYINFIAGHETTTAITTAALALICTNPGAKARVVAEALEHDDAGADDVVGNCGAYTQACIKETLRLRPVASFSLSRIVPPANVNTDGAGEGLRLHGYAIPAGTAVGVHVPAMHLNTEIFGPDAAAFRPERWLERGDEGPELQMRKNLEKISLAWGAGAHVCPGRNLAELIMGKLIPLLMREFDVEVVAFPRVEDMATFNYLGFTTGVKVRFHVRRPEVRAGSDG
ncbi:hypothetical protein DL769_000815 [Monosporascus sp. CRB-8-3]|nr:hypothetical protein DL769_000815 [Monosporascus sp. CRB-8-3]